MNDFFVKIFGKYTLNQFFFYLCRISCTRILLEMECEYLILPDGNNEPNVFSVKKTCREKIYNGTTSYA